jgi:hypothetical protein
MVLYKYKRLFKAIVIVGGVASSLQWMPNLGGHGGTGA